MARVLSAGLSEQGNVRGNNEDRYHIDNERGIYLIVDGMGGQAAGEEAAEIAVRTIRGRLERPTEAAELRIREAIALANNAIYEAAAGNREWNGMACVLTVAVLENGTATLGHVGDSRAYKITGSRIEKVTRDHSPVGEREDAGELSEHAAMRHPRRNEVFRDVGSTPRTPDDPDFIEIYCVPFSEQDCLLLCSDGLSDVVPSRRLTAVIGTHAGDPAAALRTLVDEAVANGKDNVSAVLVEGTQFAAPVAAPAPPAPLPLVASRNLSPLWLALALVAGLAAGFAAHGVLSPAPPAGRVLHVGQGGLPTVIEAVMRAEPGDIIQVGPGDYPEPVILKEGTDLRGTDAAHLTGGLKANQLQHAFIEGISAAGIIVENANVDLENVEVPGAAVQFLGNSTGSLRHSRVGSVVVNETAKPALEGNTIESQAPDVPPARARESSRPGSHPRTEVHP